MAVTETSRAAARAVDDLFRQHGSEVYRYALAVLGNHSDAEDVTQTTFLNAYRSLEQGVRPRKPSNWLLAIASNAIKQRFRQENARPHQVALDDEIAGKSAEDDGPTVGELLTALSRIPPQQRQAIVLREFEGRSYKEIADILDVTTTALETLLFRARRSLAEELEHQLTCTEAQLAVSRAADGRLGRKERRRLREHLGECADCARFTRVQQRHRTALRGLLLVPIPVSFSLLRGFEGTATAAILPPAGAAAAVATGAGTGATGGGLFAGGAAVKAAAVVTAASVAGGVGVVGATEIGSRENHAPGRPAKTEQGARIGQVAPRGVLVPGNGVARGKGSAPGQAKAPAAKKPGSRTQKASKATAGTRGAKAQTPAQRGSASKPGTKASTSPKASTGAKTKAPRESSTGTARTEDELQTKGRATTPKAKAGTPDASKPAKAAGPAAGG